MFFKMFQWMPLGKATASREGPTQAGICVSLSSTPGPIRMHNPKLLEDPVPTAHPGPALCSRNVDCFPHAQGWGTEDGSGLTHTICWCKICSLSLQQALSGLLLSVQLGSRVPKQLISMTASASVVASVEGWRLELPADMAPESLIFTWENLGLSKRDIHRETHQPGVPFIPYLLGTSWGPCPQGAHRGDRRQVQWKPDSSTERLKML